MFDSTSEAVRRFGSIDGPVNALRAATVAARRMLANRHGGARSPLHPASQCAAIAAAAALQVSQPGHEHKELRQRRDGDDDARQQAKWSRCALGEGVDGGRKAEQAAPRRALRASRAKQSDLTFRSLPIGPMVRRFSGQAANELRAALALAPGANEALRRRGTERGTMASAGSASEHIALIVDCLRRAAGASVPVGLVRSSTGVDLAREPGLLAALGSKPDIEVAADGLSLRFIPPYPDLRDAEDIVALLKRENGEAVLEQDILVSNASLAAPLQRLVDEGQVIRLRNIDAQHSAVLFARLAPILCPLPARVHARPGESSLRTEGDLSQDVVRGDVVVFEGRAPLPGGSGSVADTVPVQVRARVSRLTGQGQGPAQCLRARLTGAQDSAAPWLPHLVRDSNPYLDEVLDARLPVEGKLTSFANGAQASRLGVSADLRELWRSVRTPGRGKEPLVPGGYPKDQ
ncbi:unnamed protein product [Symbiodinium sp. KB8]|nr:unnamed protein product [Symbiodinium sp. KB8]